MPIIQSPSIDFTNSDNQSIVYYDPQKTDSFLPENKLTMSMTAQADQVVIKQNEFFLLNFDLEVEAIPKVVITPIGETAVWHIKQTADNKFKIIYQGSADLVWTRNTAFSFDILGFYITKEIANFQINLDFTNSDVFKNKTVTPKTIIVINKKNEFKGSIKLSAGFDKPQETLTGTVSQVLTFFYQKEHPYYDSFTLTFNKDTQSADFKIKKGATITLYFPFDPEDNINAIASTGAGIKQQLNQTDSDWSIEAIQWGSKGIYTITAQKDEPPMPIELKITNIQLSIPNIDNDVKGKNIVILYNNFEGYNDKFDSLLWQKHEIKATATIVPNIDENGNLYFDNKFQYLKGNTRKLFYQRADNSWIELKLKELSTDPVFKNKIELDDFLTGLPSSRLVNFKLTAVDNWGDVQEFYCYNYELRKATATIVPKIDEDGNLYFDNEFQYLKGDTRKLFCNLGDDKWKELKLKPFSTDSVFKIELDDYLTTIPITKPISFKLTAEDNWGYFNEFYYYNYGIRNIDVFITPINYGINIKVSDARFVEYSYKNRGGQHKSPNFKFKKTKDITGEDFTGACGELVIYPALGAPAKRKFSCIKLSRSSPNYVLERGEFMTSPDGECFLELDQSGTLRLCNSGAQIWTITNSQTVAVQLGASDGNLSLFSRLAPDQHGTNPICSVYDWFDTCPSAPLMKTIREVTVSNAGVLEAIDAAGKVIWDSNMKPKS